MTDKMGGIIRKIDKDTYENLITHEIKKYNHTEKRTDNIKSIKQSLRRLRDIINTNVTNTNNCLWATLTYKKNMTSHKTLYQDYRKFNMRFQKYLQKNNLPSCEYITVAEPQGRGAWHLHIIYIFDKKAPYIENSIFAKIWGHRICKYKKFKKCR